MKGISREHGTRRGSRGNPSVIRHSQVLNTTLLC